MKFEIEIDEAALAGLSPVISGQLNGDPAKRAALASFAVGEVLGWMAGKAAYQSLTEQYTEWLTDLLPVFYPDEPPSPERIFNNFSVPYGRAAYISRVLLEKQNSTWRGKGRQALLAALKLALPEAEDNITKGEALHYVPVSIDNVAYRELTVTLEELFRSDQTLMPPVNRTITPWRRTVDVPSSLIPRLITILKA